MALSDLLAAEEQILAGLSADQQRQLSTALRQLLLPYDDDQGDPVLAAQD